MNKLVIFALLMIGQVFCAFAISLLQPFFPPFAEKKNISPLLVGVIFSANPVGAIIASLVLGKILNENNKYWFMCVGIFFQSLGMFMFAATYYEERLWIVITGVIARFINGFGQSAFMTPMYAFIPRLFPDSVIQKISIAEISISMGFLVAPVIGSLFYTLGGYNLPFYVFGSFSLILVPIMGFSFKQIHKSLKIQPIDEQVTAQMIDTPVKDDHKSLIRPLAQSPSEVSQQNSYFLLDNPQVLKYGSMSQQVEELNNRLTELNEQDYNQQLLMKPLNYSEVLSSYAICMTALIGFCMNFMFNFCGPINAPYLEKQFKLSPDVIGYCQVSVSTFFIIGAFTAGKIKKSQQQIFMVGGGFVLGIAAFFTGPDTELSFLDRKLWQTLLGITIMGGAAPFLIVFNIPMLNQLLNAKFPSRPVQCANMAAALYTSGTYLGELCGPISSGLLSQQYGYPRAVTYMGCIVILICLLYTPVMFQKSKVKEIEVDTIDETWSQEVQKI